MSNGPKWKSWPSMVTLPRMRTELRRILYKFIMQTRDLAQGEGVPHENRIGIREAEFFRRLLTDVEEQSRLPKVAPEGEGVKPSVQRPKDLSQVPTEQLWGALGIQPPTNLKEKDGESAPE